MTNWSKETAKANSAAATMPGAIIGAVTRQKVCHGRRPERRRGLLERRPEALEPRPDHDDHIGQRQRDMAEQHGVQAAADADPEEEHQHRGADDEPGDGDGREQQQLQQRLAAEAVAGECQRGHACRGSSRRTVLAIAMSTLLRLACSSCSFCTAPRTTWCRRCNGSS